MRCRRKRGAVGSLRNRGLGEATQPCAGMPYHCSNEPAANFGSSFGSGSPGPLRSPSPAARRLATGFVALRKSTVGASVQLAMRAAGSPFGSGSQGAAAQPIAGCTPARYRAGDVTQIHCRSQRAAGDASRRIAVRVRIAGAAAQPIAGCTPARYRGRGVTQIHCRRQRAAGDASRRIAVRIRIAGAAAQPIAGCTPARYRVGGVTQIHCRRQCAAGDASRQDRRVQLRPARLPGCHCLDGSP